MNPAAALSHADTEILAKTPLALFYGISGSSGDFPGQQEHDRMRGIVSAASQGTSETLCSAIMRHATVNMARLTEELLSAGDAGPVMARAKQLLASVVPEHERVPILEELGLVASAALYGPSGSLVSARLSQYEAMAGYIGYPTQSEMEWTPSDEDWHPLAMGILGTFILVAAADGNISKKEINDFSRILGAARATQSDMFAFQLLAYVEQYAEALIDHVSEARRTGKLVPQLIHEAVHRATTVMPETNAFLYRSLLMFLGQRTAEADGGFLGFGSKVSATERKALGLLSGITGIPVTV